MKSPEIEISHLFIVRNSEEKTKNIYIYTNILNFHQPPKFTQECAKLLEIYPNHPAGILHVQSSTLDMAIFGSAPFGPKQKTLRRWQICTCFSPRLEPRSMRMSRRIVKRKDVSLEV